MGRKAFYKVEITSQIERPEPVVYYWYYQDLEKAKQHLKEEFEKDKQELHVDKLLVPPHIYVDEDLHDAMIYFGPDFIQYKIKYIYLED